MNRLILALLTAEVALAGCGQLVPNPNTGMLECAGSATDLTGYATLASPTFTGTVTIPNGAVLSTPASINLANATGYPGGGVVSYSAPALTLTANTYYAPPGGGGTPSTTEANSQVKSPAITTISKFQVTVSVAPGMGNSYTFTWRKGGADQTVTCAIVDTATTCQDITHSFNTAVDDLIDVKIVSAGTIVTTPMVSWLTAYGTSSVGVTSVSFTGGLITVATATTTPAFTVAGTSGGVPYFASASTWASSAAMAAGQFMLGGGAGAAPTTSFSVVPVANGGTALASGTSGGILCYTGATTLASSAALAANTYVIGGGAGVCPAGLSPAFTTQTDGATITWALASAVVANATVTLAGNRTLNITNPLNGGSYVLRVVQDGTGTRGLVLGTGCIWKISGTGAGAITPSTAAGTIDVLAFTYDGTNCYANFNKSFT